MSSKAKKSTKKFKAKLLPKVLEARKHKKKLQQKKRRDEPEKEEKEVNEEEDKAMKEVEDLLEQEAKELEAQEGKKKKKGKPEKKITNTQAFFDEKYYQNEEPLPDEDFEIDENEDDAQGPPIDINESDDEKVAQPSKKTKQTKKKSKEGKQTKNQSKEKQGDEDDDDEDDDEDAIKRHQKELDDLAAVDPEFYEHLKSETPNLLNFADDDEDNEIEGLVAERVKETNPAKLNAIKKLQKLDAKSFASLKDRVVNQRSITSLQKLVTTYRTVCRLGDEDGKTDEVRISDPAIQNRIIRFCLKYIPVVFAAHFDLKLDSNEADMDWKAKLTSSPKWGKLQLIVKSFLTNTVHFLTTQVVDIPMTRFILTKLELSAPFFAPFAGLANRVFKTLLRIWSNVDSVPARIDAFLRIRQLAIIMPIESEFLDTCLKGIYLTFVRNAKTVSPKTFPLLQLMANCVVELYALEPSAAYQHCFVYIRQMAIHLRNALQVKTKEAYRGVYNWQFVNCLRVWSTLLANHGSIENSTLWPLVYPFIQICLGVVALQPGFKFFPLHYHVCRFVNDVALKANIYVPLMPSILNMLQSKELLKPGKQGSMKAPKIKFSIKATSGTIETRQYQEEAMTHMLEILLEHLGSLSYSAAFPEIIIPATVLLKQFTKKTKNPRFQKQISQLLSQLKRNADWISQKRNASQLIPKQLSLNGEHPAVATFRPKGEDPTQIKQADLSPIGRILHMQAQEKNDRIDWLSVFANEEKNKKASKQGKRKGRGDESDDEALYNQKDSEDEEDEGGEQQEKPKEAKKKPAKKAKTIAPVVSGDLPQEDDIVTELVLSDSEQEGEEEGEEEGGEGEEGEGEEEE